MKGQAVFGNVDESLDFQFLWVSAPQGGRLWNYLLRVISYGG